MLGILAFAQRLGAWQNKHLARLIAIIDGGCLIAWSQLFLPSPWNWLASMLVVVLMTWPAQFWLKQYLSEHGQRKSESAADVQAAGSLQPAESADSIPLTFTLKSARYCCSQDSGFYNDVADKFPKSLSRLEVAPSDELFGDPCLNHKPFLRGHGKALVIEYNVKGIKMLERGKTHVITIVERWDKKE